MRRSLFVLVLVALVGAAVWWLSGGFDRVTASRVESTLVAHGLPQPLAACMGERMADRLTLAQLRKLQRLAPENGESERPRSPRDALERLRRVEDPEALRVVAAAAAICAFR